MKVFTALLLLAAASAPAHADAATDCNCFENPQLQIKGCTSFIRSGSLQTGMLSVAYTNRGIAQGNLGRVEKAIADFSEAIRLDPESPLAFYNRGNAYLDRKKLDLALADFNAAIANEPEFALAYYNRGVVLELKGQRERCIEDYQKALSLDPSLNDAKKRLHVLGIKPRPLSSPRSGAGPETWIYSDLDGFQTRKSLGKPRVDARLILNLQERKPCKTLHGNLPIL